MSVTRRGDTYRVRFRYTCPLTGEAKRFDRSCGRVTKADALAMEARWRTELEQPGLIPNGGQVVKRAAFSGFARRWLDSLAGKRSASTLRGYERALRVHLVPALGAADLRAIGVERVEQLQAELRRKGLAPKTVNNTVGVLSSLMTAAVRWGYTTRNPCADADALKLPAANYDWYTRAEADAFLATAICHRPRWAALFATALRTGLRMGELVALEWADLDLGDAPRVHVRRAWTEGVMGPPKSGKARTVPLPSDLVDILRRHPRTLDTPVVFPSRNRQGGVYPSQSCLHKRLGTVQRLGGHRPISFHELRHSYASQLASAGVPLAVVQSYLGHADLSMTQRYAHLCPVSRDQWVERLTMEQR